MLDRTDLLMKGSFTVPNMSDQGLLQVKLVIPQTFHQSNCQQSLKCLGDTFHLFQLQLSRATPALLFVYMAAMIGVGLLGLTGCWQQSANKLILTAAIQVANKHNHEKMKTQANTKTKTRDKLILTPRVM